MIKLGKALIREFNLMTKISLIRVCSVVLVLCVSLMGLLIATPVSASAGLTVDNALILATVTPGQTLTQKITVNLGSADTATNITVQVTGVAQTLNGGYVLLDASQDTGTYSARTFVSIDKDSFPLTPGGSQDITATIQVPQNVGNGGRYAMINIVTAPATGSSGMSMREAVNVPVYLTVKGSQIIDTGKITQVGTGDIVSGQPVNLFVNFQNTGNCHFKVQGTLAIKDPNGQVLSNITMPLTTSSLVPGMSRQLQASFTPNGNLIPGNYSIDAQVTLSDGTLLDKGSGSFTVKAAYTPPPTTVTNNSAPVNQNNPTTAISTNNIAPINPIKPVATNGILGISWSLAGIVIGLILIVGIIIVVLMLRRKPAKNDSH